MTALLNATDDDWDRGLVERHQAGDTTAFAQLYARHYARLVRFCRRLVRDDHTAEELAQDAFLRAYTAVDRLDGERRFYPWLTVIARRLVIDHVRRDGRIQPHAHLEAGAAGAAEDLVVQRLDGDHLLVALDRVRDRHREVLRLRDWEGLSYEAIAERLGLSPTAVPPLLHRARAALRREYLLVTEGRVAVLFSLLPVLAAARRLRDRATAWSAWMPDASALCAPVAGVALSIGALVSFAAQPPDVVPTSGHATEATSAAAGGAHAPAVPLHGPQGGEASLSFTKPADVGAEDPDVRLSGVARGSVTKADPEGVQQASATGREKPIFFDSQYIGIWVDPDEDRRRLGESLTQAVP